MSKWGYLVLLFIITLVGGFIPFLFKKIGAKFITLTLAFSGAFLFSITCLHLLPESFKELKEMAGVFILLGFFLQLLLQRLSHGVEHGHVHHDLQSGHSIIPILIGLSIHAFMEGVPLGFNYQSTTTMPSLFLGVMAHKLPEALTLSSLLVVSSYTQVVKRNLVLLFAVVSPVAALLAIYYGQKFYFVSSLLVYVIPLVIGSFLHISTTILYESGTKHHELSRQKVFVVIVGIGSALATLFLHAH